MGEDFGRARARRTSSARSAAAGRRARNERTTRVRAHDPLREHRDHETDPPLHPNDPRPYPVTGAPTDRHQLTLYLRGRI